MKNKRMELVCPRSDRCHLHRNSYDENGRLIYTECNWFEDHKQQTIRSYEDGSNSKAASHEAR